jgi:nucleosome binding factor SPN SPT16 subunit
MDESIKKVYNQRIPKLLETWNNSKEWKDFEAFTISGKKTKIKNLVGSVEEEFLSKCSIFQIWLTGYEFSNTIFLFTKKTLYIVTGKKKGKVLQDLSSDKYKIEFLEKKEDNKESFTKMLNGITKVGKLDNETKKPETLLEEWNKHLEKLEVVNINPQLNDLYSIKQKDEIVCIFFLKLF